MPDDKRLETATSRTGSTLEPLGIDLLGRFEVRVGARSIPDTAWRLRKAKSLLQLLALADGRRMHRDRVLAQLWPEDFVDDRDNAINRLNRVLHALRRVLQPDAAPRCASNYVALTGEALILCPFGSLQVDVDTFKEAAADARRTLDSCAINRAIAFYRGELLPHEAEEDWLVECRTDLRERYTTLLADSLRMYLRAGDRAGAIARLQLFVTAQPDDEQACMALMYLHAVSHRRFAALRLYQRLRDSLHALGIEPERATQRLYEQIRKNELPLQPPEIEYDLSQALVDTREDNRCVATSNPRLVVPPAMDDDLHAVPAGGFVGREREIEGVARLLETHRLVTLTGVGGAGKSRLACEVAARGVAPRASVGEGVVVVELATLTDGRLLANVVAAALGTPEEADRPLFDTLARALRANPHLLLLDNCEHLQTECAALVTALLAACPELRVLATSRRRLGAPDEGVYRVLPLAFPSPEQLPPFDELLTYDAVRLFCERARASAPGFALTPENAAAVVAICTRLDGIPLALELAARRRSHMATEQLATRLENALDVLDGAGVPGSGRNETLRATLEWSYTLLEEPERTLFRRLSVFAGNWTLEAAEGVCSPIAGSGACGTIRLLGRLVDHSLAQVEEIDEKVRYRFLEPVRQFARAKLVESGEAEPLHLAHAEWYAALAGEGDAPFRAMSQVEQSRWLRVMDAELANLRVALSWARKHGQGEIGLRLAVALEPYWYRRGMLREGSDWLEDLLALPDSQQAQLRPAAIYSACVFALHRADLPCVKRLASEGVALCWERGDIPGMLRMLTVLGGAAEFAGEYAEATAYYDRCLQLARQIGDVPREIVSLSNLADVASAQDDVERATSLYQQCLALARSLDRPRLIGMALTNLGKVELRRGRMDQAAEYLYEGLLHMRGLEEARGIAEALVPLGQLAQLRGNEREALARTVEAFELYFHAGMQVGIAQTLEALARIVVAIEAWESAAQLLAAATTLRERANIPATPVDRRAGEQALEVVARRLTGEGFAMASAQGRTRPLGELVAEAVCRASGMLHKNDEHAESAADQGATGGAGPGAGSPAVSVSLSGALTGRQREVEELIALGLTNLQIAGRLGVKKRTVEKHVANIYSRLQVHSRDELARCLWEHKVATGIADLQ